MCPTVDVTCPTVDVRCPTVDMMCPTVDVTYPIVDVTYLQLWRLPDTDHNDVLLHTEPAGDRVWSVAVSPDGR